MKFFDGKGSMRTLELAEMDYRLQVSNHRGVPLFTLYNTGNGSIEIKLVDGKFLSYDGCADGNGAEFTIGA